MQCRCRVCQLLSDSLHSSCLSWETAQTEPLVEKEIRSRGHGRSTERQPCTAQRFQLILNPRTPRSIRTCVPFIKGLMKTNYTVHSPLGERQARWVVVVVQARTPGYGLDGCVGDVRTLFSSGRLPYMETESGNVYKRGLSPIRMWRALVAVTYAGRGT